MSEIPTPPIQHIVDRDTPDPELWVNRLIEWHSTIGPFNYETSHAAFPYVYSGQFSLPALLDSVMRRGIPVGRKSNAEVIELIWNYAKDRIIHPRKVPKLFINVRRDLSIPVKADLYYSDNGKLVVSWLQPAKYLRLTGQQHCYIAAAIGTALEDTDWSGATVEIVDVSAPRGSKDRALSVVRPALEDLPSELELLELLGRFAKAHDFLRQSGFVRPERKKGPSAPPEPGLFD